MNNIRAYTRENCRLNGPTHLEILYCDSCGKEMRFSSIGAGSFDPLTGRELEYMSYTCDACNKEFWLDSDYCLVPKGRRSAVNFTGTGPNEMKAYMAACDEERDVYNRFNRAVYIVSAIGGLIVLLFILRTCMNGFG